MNIVKINSKKPEKELIDKVVRLLKTGGLVIYPTETAYGLGADAKNQKAINLIFKTKKREDRKPLSVIVPSLESAKKLIKFDRVGLFLAKKYWPGPLTLVLKKNKDKILANSVGTNDTLALRISPHPVALALAKKLKGPIVATSANVSGKDECYSIEDVKRQFKVLPKNMLIIDSGRLSKRRLSTIIRLINGFELLRPGAIKISMKELKLKFNLNI